MVVASLDRKRLEIEFGGAEISTRGIFDEAIWRKPMAFTADAVRHGI
jgi:hypothetical protein